VVKPTQRGGEVRGEAAERPLQLGGLAGVEVWGWESLALESGGEIVQSSLLLAGASAMQRNVRKIASAAKRDRRPSKALTCCRCAPITQPSTNVSSRTACLLPFPSSTVAM